MNMIVCVDSNWGIGRQGELLVDIPEDKQYFRQMTTGGVVLGGRKTMESLPGKRPLAGRDNLVLTTRQSYCFGDAVVVHSVQEALERLRLYADEKIFIMGGESVYRAFLPYCSRAYVTKVSSRFRADCFCPNLEEDGKWEIVSQSEEKCYQGIQYRFLMYRRLVV